MQWISVEILSDAVVRCRDAASSLCIPQGVYCSRPQHLPTQDGQKNNICGWDLCDVLRLPGYTAYALCWGCTNTLRTFKLFKSLFSYRSNECKIRQYYWLSAAKHLCLSVFRQMLALNEFTHRYSLACHSLFCFNVSRGNAGALLFETYVFFPLFYSENLKSEQVTSENFFTTQKQTVLNNDVWVGRGIASGRGFKREAA